VAFREAPRRRKKRGKRGTSGLNFLHYFAHGVCDCLLKFMADERKEAKGLLESGPVWEAVEK
jgi:hypothetical protein